jgi:hypothetical protein
MNLTGQPIRQKPDRADKERGKLRMALVARMACVICGSRPVEVHHCIHDRFSQKRASDMETIPLCPSCHRTGPDAIHRDKTAWRERHGPDYGFLPEIDAVLNGQG